MLLTKRKINYTPERKKSILAFLKNNMQLGDNLTDTPVISEIIHKINRYMIENDIDNLSNLNIISTLKNKKICFGNTSISLDYFSDNTSNESTTFSICNVDEKTNSIYSLQYYFDTNMYYVEENFQFVKSSYKNISRFNPKGLIMEKELQHLNGSIKDINQINSNHSSNINPDFNFERELYLRNPLNLKEIINAKNIPNSFELNNDSITKSKAYKTDSEIELGFPFSCYSPSLKYKSMIAAIEDLNEESKKAYDWYVGFIHKDSTTLEWDPSSDATNILYNLPESFYPNLGAELNT